MAYEKETDFYIHLESVRNALYPKNSPGEFEVVMPNRIDLEQRPGYYWQVGLSEISVPNGFYNIEHNKRKIYYGIRIHKDNKDLIPALRGEKPQPPWAFEMSNVRPDAHETPNVVTSPFYYRLFPIEIPEGFYDSVTFVSILNNKFASTREKIAREEPDFWPLDKYIMNISYNSITRKIVIFANYEKETKKEEYLVIKDEGLRHLFGCHTLNTRLVGNGPLEYMCNLDRGFQKLYVYSNLVKYSVVNNIQTPVLRIVQMSKELHDSFFALTSYFSQRSPVLKSMFNPHFEHIQYYPLENQEYIDRIQLKLSNEFGQDLDFHDVRDVTSVTLHFKQVKKLP